MASILGVSLAPSFRRGPCKLKRDVYHTNKGREARRKNIRGVFADLLGGGGTLEEGSVLGLSVSHCSARPHSFPAPSVRQRRAGDRPHICARPRRSQLRPRQLSLHDFHEDSTAGGWSKARSEAQTLETKAELSGPNRP